MIKARAPTVGHYKCPNPECGAWAAIRRQPKTGLLYGVCELCGPTMWRTGNGQDFFLKHGTIWGAKPPPDFLPNWIKKSEVYKVQPPVIAPPKESKPTMVHAAEKISSPVDAGAEHTPAIPHIPGRALPAANPIKKKKSFWEGGVF